MSTPAANDSVAAAPAEVGARAWLALLSGAFGTGAYMTTIAATGSAIPHMQGAFSAAPDQMAWVLTSFLVGTTIATALVGWLDAKLGTKRFYMLTALGFAASTVLCGLSDSLVEALVFRTLQGGFGAALIPLANTIVMDAFPKERHGQATALWIVVGNVGPAFGPAIGASLVHDFGWPWVYFVTVPLSLGAVLCAALFVSERRRMRAPSFDWTGFGFLVVGVAALLTMLSRGERLQWFDSMEIVVEGAVAVAAFYGFALRLAWARVPFVSAALFRDFNFVLGNVFSFLFGTIMYLAVFLIPIQLQTVAGYDIIGVGDLLGFRGAGVVLGALITSVFAMRTEPRVILVIAIAMGVVSSYAMSTWTADVRAFDVAWTIAVSGASSSVCYIPLTVLTFATLPERYRAEGMGFFYVTSLLGTSIGTAVIFNVLTRSARVNHDIMVERLNPFNELLSHGMTARAWSQEARDSLAALDAEMLRQATQIAYNNCFLLIAIVAAVLVPLCFLMRMPKGAR